MVTGCDAGFDTSSSATHSSLCSDLHPPVALLTKTSQTFSTDLEAGPGS